MKNNTHTYVGSKMPCSTAEAKTRITLGYMFIFKNAIQSKVKS